MKLILIRHGETPWNSEKRVQGFSDIGLSDRGRRQALASAHALEHDRIEAVVSSPLLRARETAQPIAATHDLPVSFDPDLRELNQGDFEGKTFADLTAEHGLFLKRWMADPAHLTVPGGESLLQLQARAWHSLERIVAASHNAAVVSHSFTIMTLLCRMQGFALDRIRETRVDLASRTVVSISDGRCSVEIHNDTSHLREL